MLINRDLARPGIYRAIILTEDRVYVPGIMNITEINISNSDGTINESIYETNKELFPIALWCAPNRKSTKHEPFTPCWVTYEGADDKRPIIVGFHGKGIKWAVDTGEGSANDSNGASSGSFMSGSVGGGISYDKYIIVGDSRMVQLVNTQFNSGSSIPSNECYICLGSMGYTWFSTSGEKDWWPGASATGYDKNIQKSDNDNWNVIQSIEDSIVENCAIVILMGTNDGGSFNYGNILDTKAKEWKDKGATTYFFTVGPLQDDYNNIATSFNSELKKYCETNIDVICYDLYAEIESDVKYQDYAHYQSETYAKIHEIITKLRRARGSISGKITIEDIQSCTTKAEYLELVVPIYQEYCREYNLKYPGVLALQVFYEVGSGFPQQLSNVAKKDNNLGGLKYSPNIPGATKGTNTPMNEWKSGSENSRYYSHFDTISDYYYAHTWQIGTSSYYNAARSNQSSVTNFTRTLLNTWVKGNTNEVPSGPVSYSESIISDYNTYNLSRYEVS